VLQWLQCVAECVTCVVHIYNYICICIYMYIYIYMNIHIRIYIYISICIYIYLSLSLYVRIYIYTCIYTYTYMHAYIQTLADNFSATTGKARPHFCTTTAFARRNERTFHNTHDTHTVGKCCQWDMRCSFWAHSSRCRCNRSRRRSRCSCSTCRDST